MAAGCSRGARPRASPAERLVGLTHRRRSSPARRSARAAPRRRPARSSGIVCAQAALWTITVASPKICSKTPRCVSTCCTRTHGISVRLTLIAPFWMSMPVLGQVPAPAPPAQLGHDAHPQRRRARAGPTHDHGAAPSTKHRRRASPAISSGGPEHERATGARRGGRWGRAAGSASRDRARRRGARSASSSSSDSKTNGSGVTGASVSASSRRTCARCAFTRSCTRQRGAHGAGVSALAPQLGHVARR